MRRFLGWTATFYCLFFFVTISPLPVRPQSTQKPGANEADRIASLLLVLTPIDREKGMTLIEEATKDAQVSSRLWQRLSIEADRLYRRGALSQSLFLHELAKEIVSRSNDRHLMIRSLNSIGKIYFDTRDLRSAEGAYMASAALAREVHAQPYLVYSLIGLANVYMFQGEYNKAKESSQQCLVLSLLARFPAELSLAGQAAALGHLGYISAWEHDYTAALHEMNKALTLYQRLYSSGMMDESGVAGSFCNIGLVYHYMGNYVQALECYSKSLAISERLNYKDGLLQALTRTGLLYLDQGDYSKAIELLGRGRQIANDLGDELTSISFLINLGATYQRQGNHDRAAVFFEQALSRAVPRQDMDSIIVAEEGLGSVAQGRGQHPLALQHYARALERARRVGDKTRQFEIIWREAETYYDMGNYETSLELSRTACEIVEKMYQPHLSYLALTSRGKAALALNRHEEAARNFSRAIDMAEFVRSNVAGGPQESALLFEHKIGPYRLMVDLLARQNKPEEALVYAERAKGRALLDLVGGIPDDIDKALSHSEHEAERKLDRAIVSLNTQLHNEGRKKREDQNQNYVAELNVRLQKARFDHEVFQNRLHAVHPELSFQRGRPHPINLKEAGQLVPDSKTALLEFVVLEDVTYLFVLTRDGQRGSENRSQLDVTQYTIQIKSTTLADQVAVLRERIANGKLGIRKSATSAYELLIGPAEAKLAGKETVVIVPDGVLWELPFQVLIQRDNKYLIESYALSYAPSLSVLREMMKKVGDRGPLAGESIPASAPRLKLLAFGNPALSTSMAQRVKLVHRDAKLVPLPEAEREVKTIARLYGAEGSKYYVGSEAREVKAKSEVSKYQVLHFATHGILDNRNPMYSHILLSQADSNPDEDGLLEAREVMKMDLSADIAVLSACETARGRITTGEGVIGMSWAFFVAGCPTTVVSQWQVDSMSTTALMIAFHKNLILGSKHSSMSEEQPARSRHRMSKAEALRQAMLTVMKDKRFKSPYYWAGFVVVGDGR